MFNIRTYLGSCLILLSSCSIVYYRLGSDRIEWDQDSYDFANEFFMGTIDLDKVNLRYSGWDDYHGGCYTVNNDIYFNPSIDFENDPLGPRDTLVHELLHIWQNQNFAWYAFEDSDYHYNLLPEKHLTEYGVEEQAAIIQDYYKWTYEGYVTCGRSLDLEYCNGGDLEYIMQIAEKRYLELQDI